MSIGVVPLAEEYEWAPVTQGLVLSAFYWTYILTQVPGGYLANRIGFKVLVFSQIKYSSSFSFLICDRQLWATAPSLAAC